MIMESTIFYDLWIKARECEGFLFNLQKNQLNLNIKCRRLNIKILSKIFDEISNPCRSSPDILQDGQKAQQMTYLFYWAV